MTIIARGAYVAKHLYLIGDDCHLIMLTDLKVRNSITQELL